MPLMLLLMQLPSHVLSTVNSDMCPCDSAEPGSDTVVLEENLTDTTTRMKELNCCARRLLAAHDPQYHSNDSITIVWSFKGKEYKEEEPWSKEISTFEIAYCGLETLESSSLQLRDEGVYSCVVTSSSGASVTKNFSLCLNMNEDLGKPPLNPFISENALALLRHKVVFSCSAYVGERRCARKGDHRLVWTKERSDGSWVEASALAHTDITTSGIKNDVMKSRLTIHSVETEHFGRYRCTITNPVGSLTLNVTLSKGVPLMDRVKGHYLAALVTLVGAVMSLIVAVLFCHRCQVAFSLHFRQKKTLSSEDHQYDMFLVHGESASRWVWSFLLPALEDSFGYTCFLPQRDMCGGSMILEEVAETVYDCRCVVVVITPCLLDSPWAAWALHNAMKAALQARTRLLALLLQDLKPRKGTPDTSGIIGILKHVRKIPVPRSSRLEYFKPKKDPHPQSPPQEDTNVLEGTNGSKALNVDTMVCRSRSKSPKNQKAL
ncbi:hypothetical protein O3P69_020560 [Scylla paramamosain]|uniref:Soluble interferon alpha/beta receptor OPG204 n=1 Tax=Scylla paramamosain TaxID=85552 RepID=A0AAW0TMT9_SCYPA